ncbi:MAG: serine hydroxymethyltransferase [Chloroflexi bacterium]|nr:serine hydroxymethyltransferase [Chloroflexota bacterium]
MQVAQGSILARQDPQVFEAIQKETERQRYGLELIPSENYPSKGVLEAQASILGSKYAEGYPGRRYYGGCQYVDVAEELARERARALFGAAHANVQPHSGSQANMAAYYAVLAHGDTVLGMSLSEGGHLTHGSPVNFSGRYYRFVPYGVDRESERIDYDQVERLAKEHKPKLILAGYTAYSRTIDFPRFRAIADAVGALFMVDIAHIAGLIAGGAHPSPVPYAQLVTSTTHKTLRGPRGAFILSTEPLAKDVDKAVFPAIQGGPFMHTIAAKAVAFGEAQRPEFALYARRVVENAQALAAELTRQGLRIVSGGTDNHLMLVDLRSTGVTGKDAQESLERAGITVNKNTIPYDPLPPAKTSGLRLGTPALTSRGFAPAEMRQVARLLVKVLGRCGDSQVEREVREEAHELAGRYPLPGVDD